MVTQQQIIPIGLFFIIVGFFIIFFGSIFLGQKSDAKYSFVGFVGPFPFGFGNDKKLLFYTLLVGVVLIVFFHFFSRKFI